jgi:RNA polymerase sigma factor (sigma-70 family)
MDWHQVIRDYSPEIWKTAYRLVGNREDAADCVQETFLSAMRLGNSQPIEHGRALLHRIATARALDCLRKRFRTFAQREPVPLAASRLHDAVASAGGLFCDTPTKSMNPSSTGFFFPFIIESRDGHQP